jgi:hypothetical protein
MQRFKSQGQAQRFVATHGTIYNLFNLQRRLISRSTLRRFRTNAMDGWINATAEKSAGAERALKVECCCYPARKKIWHL